MRHQKTRHKLSRDSAHRKALLANLCVEVIDHERIKTTEAKAKAVKPHLEKLITLAKRGDLHARRQAISTLQHPDKGVIYKLFDGSLRGTRRVRAATPASSSSDRGRATRRRSSTSSWCSAGRSARCPTRPSPSSSWSTTAVRSPAGPSSPAAARWPASCGRRCETVLRRPVALTVAGRTDRGVHATGQVASYPGPLPDLRSLNAVLPAEIAVHGAEAMPAGFSARHDARSRAYRYRVLTRAAPSPFERGRALWWPYAVDEAALAACAAALVGRHDFTVHPDRQLPPALRARRAGGRVAPRRRCARLRDRG